MSSTNLNSRHPLLAAVLVFSLAVTAPGGAGAERLKFDQLTLEDGLSQVTVTSFLQDRKGFLWLGTQDGLNRYDGYRVEVFRHDPEDPASLAENFVRGLYEDRDGDLWIVVNKMGVVSRFDPRTERFRRFTHDPDDPATPSLARIALGALHDDGEGRLWLGTVGAGIDLLDRSDGRVRHLRHDPADPTSLADDRVLVLHQSRDGTLWVGTANALHRRLEPTGDGTERFERFAHDPDDPASLGPGPVTAIFDDRRGDLWVGTAGGGLQRLDRETGGFEHFDLAGDVVPLIADPLVEDPGGELWVATDGGLSRLDPATGHTTTYGDDRSDPGSLVHHGISDLHLDRAGTLWVASPGGGLLRYDRERDAFDVFTHDPADPRSLGSDRVQAIFESRSGLTWFSVDGAGASRYSRSKHKFRHYRGDPRSGDGLTDNMVFALLEDRNGEVWVGTQNGGLQRLDRRREKVIERYALLPGSPRNLGSNWLRSICEDSRGRLWVGTIGAGLARIDRRRGVVAERYLPDKSNPRSLSHKDVFSIFEDSRGTLWLGTGHGWNRFDPERGELEVFLRRDGDAEEDAPPHNWVRLTFEDRDGDLWISTLGGLARYDRESGTFHHHVHDLNDPASLATNNVMDIHQDATGALWLATFGGGLDRLDPETGEIRHLTWRDGLPSDSIYSVVPDDEGHLWLSSNKGLTRFDPRTGELESYTVDDGLQADEFNGLALYRAADGELFFGGINGFNAFYPAEIRDSDYVPPVVLTAFHLLDREVELERAVDEVERITLSHRDDFFAFEFAALDFTAPERNRYAYKLEGFDRDWVESGHRRWASYTNLDGGRYTFRVIGSNSDGVWNRQGTSIEVVVVPPPWRSWWAYLLYAGLAGGGVFGYVRFKTRAQEEDLRRRKRTEELEQARRIQLSLLPAAPPRSSFLDVAVHMHTATEVGGDYYDFFPRADGSLYAVTGDATGHGLSAGMMVSMTKAALKAIEVRSPEVLLTELNDVLRAVNPERLKMALNVVHVTEGGIALSSAAMPPAYLCRAGTGEVEEILVPGLPLGSLERCEYRRVEVAFDPGDVLVLISDGLAELAEGHGGRPGYDAVRHHLAGYAAHPAAVVRDALVELAEGCAGRRPFTDDITVVVIRRI
jgi:ligand-binding sensor domain-containing protein